MQFGVAAFHYIPTFRAATAPFIAPKRCALRTGSAGGANSVSANSKGCRCAPVSDNDRCIR